MATMYSVISVQFPEGGTAEDRQTYGDKRAELIAQIARDQDIGQLAVSFLPRNTVLSPEAEKLLDQLKEFRKEALGRADPRFGDTGNPFWDNPYSSRFRGPR